LPPAEIVITDGGSTDSTTTIIEEYIGAGKPLQLIRAQGLMPGKARNMGVERAQSEWIALTDAGNLPEPDWLANLARNVSNNSVDVVYGSYEPVVDSFFKECAAIAYVPPPFETDAGLARPTSVVSVLMRRKVWEAVAGFPEDLRSAEDLLFMRKIERASFRIKREPEAIVHWEIQPTLSRTFKRFVEYSRHNIRAGLWREWQAAIFFRYSVLVALCFPALLLGWRWLVVPLAYWWLLMIARAALALRRNRANYPATFTRNVGRLLLLVPIITVIDAAAIMGSIKWLAVDAFRRARESER
jgi:glycosyltransferase involved in cell wall biosynthesis